MTTLEFQFYHMGRIVTFRAYDIDEAKEHFQARYGYWPEGKQVVQQ